MNTQHIKLKRMLYGLTKAFGSDIFIEITTSGEFDPSTGIEESNKRRIKIPRAIVLPAKTFRDYSYDLSFIAANKNFTYGGLYDVVQKFVIIENAKIPEGVTLDMTQRVEVNGILYEARAIREFDIEVATIIGLRGVDHESESG